MTDVTTTTTTRPSEAGSGRPGRRRLALSSLTAAVATTAMAFGALAAPAGAAPARTGSAPSAATITAHGHSFRTLDDAADPTFNQLLGINDHGVIVGYFGSGAPGHPNKGYRLGRPYGQGQYRTENFPGSTQTQVVGINDDGTTVGFWVDAVGNNFGFVERHGQFQAVQNPHTPPATSATPTVNQLLGINAHGIAVGFYVDAAGNSHGYTYDTHTGRFHNVRVPGATSVTATGINDENHITGFATINGATDGFVVSHHHAYPIVIRQSSNTQVLGINDHDEIVGSYVDPAGNTHGFAKREHHQATTIDAPNSTMMTVINGLNDRGTLVGFYLDPAGNTDGLVVR
ncbi:MAG TPA: hypothetical protein VGN18_02310 [Jatrophihabitans sp.]|uniref:hypothetical protein n=1 Tax=Jatrophihabitans sp. TaxID=1932789 RepID=UPI002DFB1D38|nr:hypothetical protein [Jatrophihabitans sp.]